MLDRKKIETRLFINGEFVRATENKSFDVYTAFDETHVANVSAAQAADVDKAVAAAKAAQPAWNALGPMGRKPYLQQLARLMIRDAEEIIMLETLCTGKTSRGGAAAIARAAEAFNFAAEMAHDVAGSTRLTEPGKINIEVRQPYGVVGAILPWNVPIVMFVLKVAPAIATGNTIVLKGSEKSPLSVIKLAALVKAAGFPPGIVNILSGFGEPCGSRLAEHPQVRRIAFTGSTATGRKIQEMAARSNLKTVTLELGGKSPSIVFADADIQHAANCLVASLKTLGGQTCYSQTRVLVEESVLDRFIGHYKDACGIKPDEEVKTLNDPTDPKNEGWEPLADRIQFERVMSYIEEGSKVPGAMITGGHRIGTKGYFVAPTIFLNLPTDSRLLKEEIFGPVVCINSFTAEAEALEKANDTEYGLSSSVFTKDISKAMRVAQGLEAGMAHVNMCTPHSGVGMPFGGWKQSGQGREGWRSGIEQMLESKVITINVQ